MQINMLDKFINAKKEDLSFLEKLEVQGRLPHSFQGQRPELIKSLNRPGPSIIAEYKRASPSKGVINSRISSHEAAEMFFKGGARAFSVLTEKKYFQGDVNFVDVFAQNNLPVLRKDFLFHPLQIKETAATRASALLLIVRVVNSLGRLRNLVEMSLAYDLEPVVEVFNYQELDLARKSGARVILVNNRDLDRLMVNLNVSRKLIKDKDSRETWICASGIEKKSQVDEFYALGFEAFLIGTSIMSSNNPEISLKELTS